MTKTTTELADAVLRELGVVDAEETPDTVDRNYVVARYEDKFEELSAPGLDLTYWPVAAIPDAVFLILRNIMMMEVQGAFGEPLDPAEKEAREAALLRPLRRHVSRPATGVPAQSSSDYF